MRQECWLEIDLYWFQGGDRQEKVCLLFDRLGPLWNWEPAARKGLCICAGWLTDLLLCWNGNPDDPVPTCVEPTYHRWTYGELGELAVELRAEAARRGIDSFHVAFLVLASQGMAIDDTVCTGWRGRTDEANEQAKYHINSQWCLDHPEALSASRPTFRWDALVRTTPDDLVHRDDGVPFHEYLARKTSDLTEAIGIDGILFRDAVFAPAYIRGGPSRYAPDSERRTLTRCIVDALRLMKEINPDIILMGYGNGTSAIEEYRSHGFDLEAVAASGHLDIWITQTWASAWQDYWPAHSMGYTFQLTSLLVHAAQLAPTPCHHLFLVETFDAWEPWDSIGQYPAKVGWEIWAYSHAAVKQGGGVVKRPRGCYISWMNRGGELLGEDAAALLRRTLREAADDLRRNPVPGGPTLVYDRDSLEALSLQPADHSRGEEIDDWGAMLMKYGLPILSITRAEWLAEVKADGFILGPTMALPGEAVGNLLRRVKEGLPVLLLGQAAFHHGQLRETLGIPVEEEAVTSPLPSAGQLSPTLWEEAETTAVVLNQRARTLATGPGWTPLVECLGGPVAARHTGGSVYIWETPEWGTPRELHLSPRSVQSLQTYLAMATEFSRQGWGAERLYWINDDWTKPICFHFWRHDGGGVALLVGNLEFGMTGNSQFCVRGRAGCVLAPELDARHGLRPTELMVVDSAIHVGLHAHRSAVVSVEGQRP